MGNPTRTSMTCLSDHHAPLRSVQLDHLCIGLLRQCRRTRVIERLASVSRFYLPHLRSSMPPQRQCSRLTTEELARAVDMLKCGSSKRRVANVFGLSQSVSRAWNRFQTRGSATQLVVDNEQPRQERTDFLWYRPDVIPS